jgi:mRNA interferase MazF
LKNKVVLVPFPFDDLSSSKVRPAACLTEPIGRHDHVVLAFITSRLPENPELSDVILRRNEEGFEATGLRVSSAIRLHRLMTVTTELVRRELGELSPKQQEEVNQKLHKLFELDR